MAPIPTRHLMVSGSCEHWPLAAIGFTNNALALLTGQQTGVSTHHEGIPMEFVNAFSKRWMARKGPTKVFGRDVDRREQFTDDEAERWFDQVWASTLFRAVEEASPCDIDFVLERVGSESHRYIHRAAEHREFTLANCQFICQLPQPSVCDQLWFIPSTSPDPRTLYVKFMTVPHKEEFDHLARRLGWEKPEEMALKILLDFMETVNRKDYRSPDGPGG